MKNHVIIVAVLVFFILLTINQAYTDPSSNNDNPQDQYIEGELLVKFKPGTPGLAKSEANRGVGTSLIKDFQSLRLQHVELPKGLSVQAAIESYEKNPNIEYAEPNYVISTDAFPADPSFNQLWGLHNEGQTGGTFDADIDAPEAWDITTGMSNTVVAVIDTGIDYNHEDIVANMWTNQVELYGTAGVDDDGNGYIDDIYGIDTINGDSDPMDDHYHGTHVAGTIGAVGNNSIGVAGVNWNISILACKFLGWDGYGTTAGAIECVDYINALKQSGVNIIASNNSWGGGGYSMSLRDAIDAQRDILFIAAAGNSYTDNDVYPHYPSSYDVPNVIAVTATDNDDIQRYNYGRRTVHVAAPGYGAIYSTKPGNSYGSLSGTSMATPHVTGVAALLSSEYPALSWKEIKNLILAGGDDKPTLTDTTITGKRLNAMGSLTCTDSPVFSALKFPDSLTIGIPVRMSALSINCENPLGPVTVTVTGGPVIDLYDDGAYPDAEAGDGIFTADWISTVDSGRVTYSSPGGSETLAPNFKISTPFLVEGNVNSFYSQTLETVEGVAPITWSITLGALPPGLSLNSASGEISGQPVVEGTYLFKVEATGADGLKVEKDFALKVVNSIIIAEWAKYFDGVMDEAFNDVARDSEGNIYAAGHTANFVNETYDFLIIKYDESGNIIWSRTYDDGGDENAYGIAIDNSGNVVVTGEKVTYPLEPPYDPYFDRVTAKYDSSGTLLWDRTLDMGSNASAHDVAVDTTGNVYITGFGFANATSLDEDILTAIYDPDGNLMDEWSLDRGSFERGHGIAVDSGGNVIVSGESGFGEFFTVKYDPSGAIMWERPEANEADAWARDVAVDGMGNIYAVGAISNTVVSNNMDVLIYKYDPSGNIIWNETYYDSSSDDGMAVDVDPSGNVYIAGSETSPESQFLVLKYDADGSLSWERRYQPTPFGANEARGIVADASGNAYVAGQVYDGLTLNALLVKFSMQFGITTNSLPNATVGQSYDQTLTAAGGQTPYSWGIVNGTLPQGLSLDGVAGTISGTPTLTETSNFKVQVTDANSDTATKNLSITVIPSLVITTLSLPDGEVGTPYGENLTAAGGVPPYSWAIINGGLPNGLFYGQAGYISGTPTTPGTFNFTAQVTDANSDIATKNLSITIADPLMITTTSLSDGEIGTPYNETLTAEGGQTPYSWGIVNGTWPNGLILNSTTGDISGTPTTAGTSNFTAQVMDANSDIATKNLSITINGGLSITTASFPNGKLGTPYNQTLTAIGGQTPYSWSIISGGLPPSLSLDSASGTISGTPTTAGTFNFDVEVTDAALNSTTKGFTIFVQDLDIVTVTFPPADIGISYQQTLEATGGTPPYTWSVLSGILPFGLTLDSVSGMISGIPTTSGTYSFTIQVQDAGFVTDVKNLSISVDPEVETLWETSFDSGEDDYVQDVAVDAWGNMYIAGYLNDGTQKDSLTVKLDPSGNFLWAKEYDSGFDDTIRAMDLDEDGNAYVLGTYHTGTTWMRLIIKYDPDGNVLFNLHLDSGQRITNDIAVDKADGSFYVVTTGFETYKYDADGNPLWNRSYGSQLADNVFVDDQGHVYVVGHKLVDSQYDIAVVIYDSSGNELQAWTYDSGLNETVEGLAVDPEGNVIVGGYVHNGTNHDRMLVKFDSTGNLIWSHSYDDGSYEYVRNIAADSDGSIYVASGGGLTIKYDSDGQEVWRVAETAVALMGVAVDDMFNVYVAGTGSDYKAFKYKQNLPLEIRTAALPDGNVAASYNQTLEAAGGTLPYTWSIASGSLPDGLVLDSGSGVISGIPTTPGTSNFIVHVVGARGKTAYRGLSLTVHELQITTTTLSYGTVGTAYVQGLSASGGVEPFSWTITNGVLPDGLTLDGPTGVISGTPTTAGTSNFTVQVTDVNSMSATKDLSIVVYDPLGITTSSLSYGVTGRAYSESLAATGGLEPYSWAITNSTLPNGLIINSMTGDITGTPTTAGVSVFTATVTDANTEFDSRTLSIPIYDPVSVDTVSLPYGVTGRAYSDSLSASGGLSPYTWSIVGGSLPDGLTLDGVTGDISGTPTTTGVFNFTVQATDDNGETGSGALSIAVYDPVSVSTTSLPNGEVGAAYNESLSASGGLTPYAWSLTAGSLPDGLSLDGVAGVISGTPTTSGIFDFTMEVIDANAETASQDLSIAVGTTTTYYILTASNCGAAIYARGPQYAQLGTASGDCSVGDTVRWKFMGGPNDMLVGYLANGGYATNMAVTGDATGNDLSFFINGSGGTGYVQLAEVNPSDGTIIQVLSTVSVSISPDTLTSMINISALSGTVSAGNTVGIVLSMTSTERDFNEITWGTTGGGPGLEQWFTITETPLGSAPPPPSNNPPVAAANGPYNGTVNTPVAFSSSGSDDPDGDTLTYLWDFGDGNTSTEANPTHTYTAANTYTVTLTVTDTSNASDTDTTTATITDGTNQPPVADAGSDKTAQVREIITFDGSGSYDPDGTISSYAWDFGDGKTDSGVTVSHDYKKDGTYTVTLTVTDNQGATAQDTPVVTVNR